MPRKLRLTYKRPDSPFYQYSFTVEGARFRGSCETADPDLAETIALERKRRILLGQFTEQREDVALTALLARYWQEHACRQAQAADVKSTGHELIAFFGAQTPVRLITQSDVSRFVANQYARGLSPATINRKIAKLRKSFNLGESWGYRMPKIDWTLFRQEEPDARTQWLEPQVIDRLLAHAADHLRPIIRFSLLTGCRRGNTLSLRWEQVQLESRLITFKVKSKKPGGKTLTIPIIDDCAALLREIGWSPDRTGPVFTCRGKPIASVKTAWRAACRRAAIEDFRFHDLRHTCASWLRWHGIDLPTIQLLLGHADIRTTQKYSHAHRDELGRAMAAALNDRLSK